jgi:hypothetical protein
MRITGNDGIESIYREAIAAIGRTPR